MELIEWESIKQSVMISPGKARLYSTLIFSALHFFPPLVKTVSKLRLMAKLWINGPSDFVEPLRTPLASVEDLKALEEEQRAEMTRRTNEMTWNMWDTLEVGLTFIQAVADSRLLSAAIQLQYDELLLSDIMARFSPGVGADDVAARTIQYFDTRDHHRALLDFSRKWIYTSFALDALHLAVNVTHVVVDHFIQQSNAPKEGDRTETKGEMLKRKYVPNWRAFIRSSIIYNLSSIATNSLWYSIFVTTPTFQPKGIASFAVKVLNNI